MKYNHTKAQEICQRLDPERRFYVESLEKLQSLRLVFVVVFEIFEEQAEKYMETPDLKEYLVVAAESIYQTFEDEIVKSELIYEHRAWNNDNLFEKTLMKLYAVIEELSENVELKGEIFDCINNNIYEVKYTEIYK